MEYTGFNDIQKKRIAESFVKANDKAVPMGTIREWGGRKMIKTADGWKPASNGPKGKQHQEAGKVDLGGGAKVGIGSKITNMKEKVTGTVSHVDETHAHIDWKDKEGEKKTTKVPHDHLHEGIQNGDFEHHVPAEAAHEASGAADKEKLSDPKNITDMDSAYAQLDNYFKGDKEAERTLKFLKGTLKDSNVRIDTGMQFDDDRILGLSYPDGRIGVNIDSPYARDKESVYRTLMHEMVHAATRDAMKNSEVLQDEFNSVLNDIRKHLDLPDNDALVKHLYANGQIGEDKYGASDQYELVAEVFTNPEFTKLLKSIPYKKSNLLHRVMTSIFAVFGGTAKKVKNAKRNMSDVDNMADYLVNLTEKVFKPESKKAQKKDAKNDKKSELKAAAKMAGGNTIKKSEEVDTIEKGTKGGGAPIGTIKEMGGRNYIKTASGWKYHAKGGSAPAHAAPVPKPHNVPTEVGGHEAAGHGGVPQDDNPKVNINERFSASARQTKAVIKGAAKCQILYGTGGVGKTYGVTHLLDAAGMKPFDEDLHKPANTVEGSGGGDDDDEDEVEEKSEKKSEKSTDYDYIKITGKMTAPQVYKALYEHNGKLLLFDDCDSVLQDQTSVNLFKGALDSSGDGTVSYGTSTGVKDEEGNKLPKRFKFTGKAIFISNLPSHAVPQPIKSRALRADLSMTPEQTIDRLKFIAKNKEGKYQNLKFKGVSNYSHKDMEDIINFLDKHKHNTSDLNVRTVGSMLAIKHIADQEGTDWRKDAEHMIFSKGESYDVYNGGILKAQFDRLMKSYSDPEEKKAPVFEKADVKSLEFRDHELDKAMGTGNTPGMETVEDAHGKVETPAQAAVQKSLSDAYDLLGL